jgi:hypothetical protein
MHSGDWLTVGMLGVLLLLASAMAKVAATHVSGRFLGPSSSAMVAAPERGAATVPAWWNVR